MKILIGAGIAILLGVAGWFIYNRMDTNQSCDMSALTIVAFGDSLVTGYGAPKSEDAFSVLSKSIGVPITNLGVSGNTSADALARIDDVIKVNPDIVIVLLGGNDALQSVPVSITEQNLSRIIERIQASGSKVLLVGVLGGFPSDPYAPMFERLSNEYAVPLVPNILSGLIGREEYMSDAIHPNAAGYERIAQKLMPSIESLCSSS